MSSKDNLKDSNSKDGNTIELSTPPAKDPTPLALPTTSKDPGLGNQEAKAQEPKKKPWMTRCWKYIYDKERRLFCGRTCRSWWCMVLYSIMYLIFLSTYTMIFLYATLSIIKMTNTYNLVLDKFEMMTYADNGIGLTVTPSTLHTSPVIWYTDGHLEEYSKYVKSLDELLAKRKKRQVANLTDLGPCGTSPYGYGDEPCVIIRLNKQIKWSAKPINASSTRDIPKEVLDWLKMKEQKLWLHCTGSNSYDTEHIGSIKYYPYPPGFDPGIFPLDMQSEAPLIAIQFSDFTRGLSLSVECKLWYDNGYSSVAFVLYVGSKNKARNEK